MNETVHLEQISPYIRYVNDLKKRGYLDFKDRIIYDNELIFCVDGSAKMILDDEEYVINRGDIFFLRPGLKNRMVLEDGEFFHAHCIHFDWCPMDENVNFTAEQAYIFPSNAPEDKAFRAFLASRPNVDVDEFLFPPLICGTDYDKMLPLFRGMYTNYREASPAGNLRMRGMFLEILAEMMFTKDPSYSSTEKSHRLMVDRAMAYINEHYREEIAVPMLAELVGMSGKYFGVIFKRVAGLTVSEYVLQVRMQKTEELLLKTSLSLGEIADEVGVGDEYYIVKLFKRYKGITPGRYRRMLLYAGDRM